jgi:hypothetical protein
MLSTQKEHFRAGCIIFSLNSSQLCLESVSIFYFTYFGIFLFHKFLCSVFLNKKAAFQILKSLTSISMYFANKTFTGLLKRYIFQA